MNRIKLKAPAKINLGLNVVSKRDDGFHNLETFFYPIKSLFDELTFTKADSFTFSCNNEILQKEGNNLISSAHNLLEDFTKKNINVNVYLGKFIPIGAGLGGGSSDAAFTLVGLNKLFNLNICIEDLSDMALTLGSDVPFFIKAQAAVGKFRGEILDYSKLQIEKPILIVNPGIHISTKEVFSNIDPKESKFDYNYFLESPEMDFDFLKNNLTNDFEYFVFDKYPMLKSIKENMYKAGALFSLMSGTGSTVYGIFNTKLEAQEFSNMLDPNYIKIII